MGTGDGRPIIIFVSFVAFMIMKIIYVFVEFSNTKYSVVLG